VRLERARDGDHVAEVRRRVGVAELGRIGDMSAAPDDDRVAGLTDVAANEVGIGDAASEDPRVPVRFVGTFLRAHRTALSGAPLVPVGIPGTAHRLNASVPAS